MGKYEVVNLAGFQICILVASENNKSIYLYTNTIEGNYPNVWNGAEGIEVLEDLVEQKMDNKYYQNIYISNIYTLILQQTRA